MKKIIILLLVTNITTAQNMYVAEYNHTNNNDFTCRSYLYSNGKECAYKIGDNRPSGEITTKNGGVDFISNDDLSTFFYYDNEKSYHRFLHNNLEWFYSDNLVTKLNWIINNDVKKKIAQYSCTQAKLNINGRNFTVWFTYEVPLKFGPLKLHNLPGLVVEVTEDTNWLKISLINYKKTKEITDFFNLKKYSSEKKNVSYYELYEKDLTNHELSKKLKFLAYIKETKHQGAVFDNEMVPDYFLDIPINLLPELLRLH